MAKKKQPEEVPEAEADHQTVETEESVEETPEAAETPEPTLEEKLTGELKDANDQLLRLAAEYDNFRRRSIKEKEELYKRVRAEVVGEFLHVIDNLERAAQTQEGALADYRKGMEMIFAQFQDILQKLGATAFGEAGEAFDPKLHHAVMHIDDENLPENSVAQVFAKGYKIGDQLIRPAAVQAAN